MNDCIAIRSQSAHKKKYIPPVLRMIILELEDGISAGSALVRPGYESSIIEEEWETGNDIEGEFAW